MLPRAIALLLLVSGIPAAVAATGVSDCADVSQLTLGWSDPDGDGLPWRLECATGTSPREADSDRDGLPDDLDPWPLRSDASGDRDCDGVDDRRDLIVRGACEALPNVPAGSVHLTVAVGVVGASVRAATLEAVDALAPRFEADFAHATGGAGSARFLPARALAVPEGAPDLRAASWQATVGLLSEGDADLVVLLADGLPHAPESCACDAWSQRVHALPGTEGPAGAFDLRGAYGSERLLAVVSLGQAEELPDGDAMRERWLHEAAHTWCCRSAPAELLTEDGAHWVGHLVASAPDPLGPQPWRETTPGLWAPAEAGPLTYAPATRLALGLVAPSDVEPLRVLVPRGPAQEGGVPGAIAHLSPADLLLVEASSLGVERAP